MDNARIDTLRRASRKLVRELGIVQLDKSLAGPTAQHCHALMEIAEKPKISISELAGLLLLSVSNTSRIVQAIAKAGFITMHDGIDRREKELLLTAKGKAEVANINRYSVVKVQGAFDLLTTTEQDAIISAIQTYAGALETSRCKHTGYKILTLSTSRPLRKQIVAMVEAIQKGEFQIPVTDDINACILRAEDDFYYNNSYNFWYGVDENGAVIGSVGLKKLDENNAELKKLFVHKGFRGKGVAHKLLQTVVKAALRHGFTKIWLGTVDVLAAARAFYAKNDFASIDEKNLPENFVKCPLDTHFFCRKL